MDRRLYSVVWTRQSVVSVNIDKSRVTTLRTRVASTALRTLHETVQEHRIASLGEDEKWSAAEALGGPLSIRHARFLDGSEASTVGKVGREQLSGKLVRSYAYGAKVVADGRSERRSFTVRRPWLRLENEAAARPQARVDPSEESHEALVAIVEVHPLGGRETHDHIKRTEARAHTQLRRGGWTGGEVANLEAHVRRKGALQRCAAAATMRRNTQ